MREKEFYRELALNTVKEAENEFDYLKVYIGVSQSTEVEVLNKNVENCTLSENTGMSIVGSKAGKTASVSSSDLTQAGIATLKTSLQQLIDIVEPDPHYTIPQKEDIGQAECELDLIDTSFYDKTVEDYIREAVKLESLALAEDKRLFSSGAFSSAGCSIGAFACSYGFSASTEGSYFSKGVTLAAEDKGSGENTGKKQRNGWHTTAVNQADLQNPESVAEKACYRVISRLGAEKPPTGEFPVIFDNITARSFFASVASAATGSNIYKNESFLRNSLGKVISVPFLTIRENPFIVRGLGSRLFDVEGVKSREFDIVKEGVLNSYLLSVYSAKRLGLKTTGSAGGFSNIEIRQGNKTLDEIIKNTDKGILITSLIGQGANIKNGDYSKGGEGFLIENGNIGSPVSEFTVSSTFQDMLLNIEEIGNDIYTESSVRAPSIKFRQMTMAGK